MLVDFNSLPDEARVWIYPCSRKLEESEVTIIKPKLQSFIESWTSHGQNLKAGFTLPYNNFIVIGLDEKMKDASGCSIDASVHFIQEIEKEFDIDLLDKMNVSYKEKQSVIYTPLKDFKKQVKAKKMNPNTIVFNNLVNNKYEFTHHWEVPASESWHNRLWKK